MPQDSRALTRAARARATRTGEPYTAAREAVIAVRTLMTEHGLDEAAATVLDDRVRELMDRDEEEFTSYADALAHLTDPANQVMCEDCGWTRGMVCPECAKGCGCETRCTGWRHRELAADDAEDLEDEGCPECGAGGSGDPYEECVCYPG